MNVKKFNKRLRKYEKTEIKKFAAQVLTKIDKIVTDEEIRSLLINQMLTDNNKLMLNDERYPELCSRYGSELTELIIKKLRKQEITKSEIFNKVKIEYTRLMDKDPLSTWQNLKCEERHQILVRIRDFASHMSELVKFSLLINPGHLRCHLSAFIDDFNEFDNLFDNVKLDPSEISKKAYEANYLIKARHNDIECVDLSRVIIKIPECLTNQEDPSVKRYLPVDIFGEVDCPIIDDNLEYGTGDFIHANYIKGGPLLNNFICTQAPTKNTVNDFWRMVWQEKTEYIFMLCDATEDPYLEELGVEDSDRCPVYWPKLIGNEIRFGSLIIRNNNIHGTVDPVFTVTDLVVYHVDHPEDVIHIQHWQYDWRQYEDYKWPLRILRRSRTSSRPTVVHCLDGCGKSGTLVLIEVLLMQILRGSVNYDHPVITCATFVRLQRRCAIANHVQYLFAYRVVLEWLKPYIKSILNQFKLGLIFDDSGFVGKYDRIIQKWSKNVL